MLFLAINHGTGFIVLKRIKRITSKVAKPHDRGLAALSRMGKIALHLSKLADTDFTKRQAMKAAVQYHAIHHDHLFLRIRQCITKAEKEGSWAFMHGCFSQATEIYAVASIAYEVFNQPIMSDGLFDSLAEFLLKNYDSITDFCKKEWNLNKGIFRAGTGSPFHDIKLFPQLLPYYNRLQEHYKMGVNKRERARAENNSTILRKPNVRTGTDGQGRIRKTLRRPIRKL